MTAYEGFILLMWFIGAMGVFGTAGMRLVNIFHKGEYYADGERLGWGMMWLVFIAGLISFGFVHFANMLAQNINVSVFTSFLLLISLLSTMLWVVEILLMVAATVSLNAPRGRREGRGRG